MQRYVIHFYSIYKSLKIIKYTYYTQALYSPWYYHKRCFKKIKIAMEPYIEAKKREKNSYWIAILSFVVKLLLGILLEHNSSHGITNQQFALEALGNIKCRRLNTEFDINILNLFLLYQSDLWLCNFKIIMVLKLHGFYNRPPPPCVSLISCLPWRRLHTMPPPHEAISYMHPLYSPFQSAVVRQFWEVLFFLQHTNPTHFWIFFV